MADEVVYNDNADVNTEEGSGMGTFTIVLIILCIVCIVGIIICAIVWFKRSSPVVASTTTTPEETKKVSQTEEAKNIIKDEINKAIAESASSTLASGAPVTPQYMEHMKSCICAAGDKWTADQCKSPDVFSNGNCYRNGVAIEDAKKLCDAKPGCKGFDYVPEWGNQVYFKTVDIPIIPHDVARAWVKK